MKKKMLTKRLRKYLFYAKIPITFERKIYKYLNNGRIPWSIGYNEYKWQQINKVLSNNVAISFFKTKKRLQNFGIGIDERIVEYPWIFANLSNDPTKILDAGSTFNFKEIVEKEIVSKKELSITTYHPEPSCFHELRISYIYSDVRNMPFKDEFFDEVVCQSTIEHIDMDNTIYGYTIQGNNLNSQSKNYEYVNAISELLRVLKKNGTLLITFPFGCFENHGFFQQFDDEMLTKILTFFIGKGTYDLTFFKYDKNGWNFAQKDECHELKAYNPHTGIGKGQDGAAHSRGICCIKFVKIL